MAIPFAELNKVNPSSIIELFEIELSVGKHIATGNPQSLPTIYRFHAGANLNSFGEIIFQNQTYQRVVVKTEGFEGKSTSDSRIMNAYSTGNGVEINFSMFMYIYNAGDSSKYTFINTHLTKYEGTVYQYQFGGGVLPTTSKVTGVRAIEAVGGTYDSFEVKVYGVKQI